MTFTGQLLQFLLGGITLGSIYALIGLGFVTTYTVTGIINFTQGEFVMLGAMLAAIFTAGGLPLGVAVLLSVILVALFGAVFERVVIYPCRQSMPVTIIIITIGAAIAIRGLGLLLWGTDPIRLPDFSPGEVISIAGAALSRQSIWVIGTGLAAMLLLFLFLQRTVLGKALRACAINRTAAKLVGINPHRMSLYSFTASALLGALAGVVIAPITTATYDMGLMLGLKGFVAAVLGGLFNPNGAVLGGFLLGVLEALGAGLISSGYKDAIAFLVLLIVLIRRPQGILGGSRSTRV